MNKFVLIKMMSPLWCILFLYGCSSSDSTSDADNAGSIISDGRDMQVSLGAPNFFTAAIVSELKVRVSSPTINGGTPAIFDENATDNIFTRTISNVPAGNHALLIEYYVGSTGIVVANISQNVTVIVGETTDYIIADSDLNRDIDDDNDGYTNLAEVRIGTDAADSSSTPEGSSPLFTVAKTSSGNSTSTSFSMSASVGENISGNSTSASYAINAGFQGL